LLGYHHDTHNASTWSKHPLCFTVMLLGIMYNMKTSPVISNGNLKSINNTYIACTM